jgi:hypothetical protein
MMRIALLVAVGVFLAPGPAPPREPLLIAVAVETAAGKARADTSQPASATRPGASARAGEAPRVRWFVQNRIRDRVFPQSVYHFFITRIERPGQELPAEPKPGSVVDNSFAQQLPAGGATMGTCKIPISEPGVYRVQFEVLNRAAVRQQYCGVDLTVE